jgi:hypothetical protein
MTNSGNVKIAITSSTACENYESLLGPYASTDVSVNLSKDQVAMLRYKYTTSCNATLTLSSTTDTDTYLYIIDPRSTEFVVRYTESNFDEPNLYDDDSLGSLHPQIAKMFVANVEYLVIVSFLDPHTMEGVISINSTV